MRRRSATALFVAALAIGGCGPAQTDPYALLDRAWTVGWDRVQLQLGLTLEFPNQGGALVPVPGNVNLDPSAITAIVDTHTRQWRLTLSIPGDALGPGMIDAFGLGVQSIEADLLFDGTNLFAKSPLLQRWLQPGAGSPPLAKGDLTGWVRLGSTDDLATIVDPSNPMAILPIAAPFPGLAALHLPAQGDPAALRQYFEDFGVVAEFEGTEPWNGRDAHHVAAGLDIAKLARNDRFAFLLGWGREEQQSMSDNARQFAISSDAWFDKESGRLVGLDLNFRTVQAPVSHLGTTLVLSEPTDADPFAAPESYTDVPLKELLGIGATGGDDASGGPTMATPAPPSP